jgi:hypothetical protein
MYTQVQTPKKGGSGLECTSCREELPESGEAGGARWDSQSQDLTRPVLERIMCLQIANGEQELDMRADKQMVLRPLDVPVALRFAECPGAPYHQVAEDLAMSSATVYESVARLEMAQILRPGVRAVNRHALLEFLEHGVRYAFPAAPTGLHGRGVPTAHSAPPLVEKIDADEAWVWPSREGGVEGQIITPLFERAVELPQRCPGVYEMLALLDSVRAGRARERSIAIQILRDRLGYRKTAHDAA